MSGTVPVNFRVLPTEREAWKQQAEKEGISLTELVRQVMNARLGKDKIVTGSTLESPVTPVPVRPIPLSAPGPSFERPRRTETCEHRLPAGTYCRFGCDD